MKNLALYIYIFLFNVLEMTEIQHDSKQENIEKGEASECPFTSEATVDELTKGLASQYNADLERVKAQLLELMKEQGSLIEKLESENARFPGTSDLLETFSKVKHYHNKLESIKKEMAQIHERTAKVKKRAMKLQHNCQKEALMREQRKEEQLQREQQLIAKPGVSRKSKP